MIMTIISVTVLIIGLICLGISFNSYSGISDILGTVATFIGSISTLIVILVIIFSHTNVNLVIDDSNMEYKGLVKRLEIVNSEYEDMSKSDVINDITEWNRQVYREKYWGYNEWTNWFHSREYVDSLHYIDLESNSEVR